MINPCHHTGICGGCKYRHLNLEEYKEYKEKDFLNIIKNIPQEKIKVGKSIFIKDGSRRRASLTFLYKKHILQFGFNQEKSHDIVDIFSNMSLRAEGEAIAANLCPLLTSKINANLENIKKLILELCQTPLIIRDKKRVIEKRLTEGDISITEADNGLDIVFDFDFIFGLEHQLIISEFMQKNQDIIRVSIHGQTILEIAKPYVVIEGITAYLPPASFLQSSKDSEIALINLVKKYAGDANGKIFDLFCGIGTFSYPFSKDKNNKITSVDSSASQLESFKQAINRNQIKNIEVVNKNIFKYPLNESDLKNADLIILDPPRAGASTQVAHIKEVARVIYVSCNPHSFIKDAASLLNNGYHIEEITLIDQFIYSNHSELVALFTKP